MARLLASSLIVLLFFGVFSLASDQVKLDSAKVVEIVSEQQGEDPIIGIWNGAAGGYSWQTAIFKNPNAKDGYEFVGVLLRPWPLFKKGEIHIYINKTSAHGVYEGKEKWKSLFGSSWSSARFFLIDANQLTQSNNIGFQTPLGSDWTLLRKAIPSPPSPLKHTIHELQTARIAPPGSPDTVESVIFVWFDEKQPQPGTQVIEVVVTARAYEAVLGILREVRGSNTSVMWGSSVLETNYHPLTFQLGEWIGQQSSPEQLTSVFYWEDEVLSETTPVMNFYMTRHAYEGVISAVQGHFAEVQKSPQLAPEKKKKLAGFLKVLGVVAQGALAGMANYYATVRPIEEQQIALQQAAAAERTQAAAAQQQVWELQRLNQQIDQMNTQRFLDQLRRDGEQYGRMLRRYSTGSW